MSLIEEFINHLKLEPVADDLFHGHTRFSPGSGHVFGGQVLAQAISAATQTVTNRSCHSLNCYFLRAFDHNIPIEYKVSRTRDGGSFSHRKVSAIQNNKELLTMEASFQVDAAGFSHQPTMPEAPPLEAIPDMSFYKKDFDALNYTGMYNFLVDDNVFEFRCTDKPCYVETSNRPPIQQIWFKSRFPLADDSALHLAMLVYVSDNNFMRTSTLPHREELLRAGFQLASLNHSMWIHRMPNLNEWHLYDIHSSVATNQRGMVLGHIYQQSGELLATTAQEGMMRTVDNSKSNNAFSEGN
jgi:acyl-CoA thioesterase II